VNRTRYSACVTTEAIRTTGGPSLARKLVLPVENGPSVPRRIDRFMRADTQLKGLITAAAAVQVSREAGGCLNCIHGFLNSKPHHYICFCYGFNVIVPSLDFRYIFRDVDGDSERVDTTRVTAICNPIKRRYLCVTCRLIRNIPKCISCVFDSIYGPN
jgi:hypothetical protein